MHKLMVRLARAMAVIGGLVLSVLIVITCISVFGRALNTVFHGWVGDVMTRVSKWFLDMGVGPILGDFELVEAGVPGMRTGWVIASKENIELFRNFSSLAMGGVSRASQIYVAKLLEIERVAQARKAIGAYFGEQRERYAAAFEEMGLKLYTGEGGFYHWCRLPDGKTADEFNARLFKQNAAILPGFLCDMNRRGNDGPHGKMFRFSFGATPKEDFDESIEILKSCLV